jgi:hypothetical protein
MEGRVAMRAAEAVRDQAARNPDAEKDAGRSNGSNGPLERVTVNLTGRSSRALEAATDLSGDTKTDIINRALQIYAFLENVRAQGGSIHVRESAGGELSRIEIF